MKPSELPENGWIKIELGADYLAQLANDDVQPSGAIAFHRYYGELACFAINHGDKVDDANRGLLITDNETEADAIYDRWADKEHAEITHG